MLSPEKILSDLIRINTVNPGNELEAALYLKIFNQPECPARSWKRKKGGVILSLQQGAVPNVFSSFPS